MRAAAAGDEPSLLQLPALVAMSTTAAAPIDLRMTVSPADEMERLRELLGECGEFGGTMGEILYRFQLLGGGGRDGLGFVTGRLRGGACLAKRVGDSGRQLRALPSELGDLFAGACRLGRCFGDAIEILYPRGGVLHHLTEIAADALDQLRRAIQRPAGILHGFADVA